MISITEDLMKGIAIEMVKRSCTQLPRDVMTLLRERWTKESNSAARRLLEVMLKNAELAAVENKPICQSPGYPVLYVTLGSDFILCANIQKIFAKAIVDATKKGYLRPSIVHPFSRENSGDNSGLGIPDVEIESNPDLDYLELTLSFKGCGSELANRIQVLTPAQIGEKGRGIKRFILEATANAGGIPCPPVAVGIGIGGQMHYAAKLSRKVVGVREWTDKNPDPEVASLENELLQQMNSLGIGPAGIGGDTTALAVKVGMVSTHTAICPIAVNFHCWVGRKCKIRVSLDKSFTVIS
ncbi:MAG: fumarate hydratase [Nitrososphaerales archaeon]